MIEPWFSAETAPWLAYLSLFALVGVLDMYAEQGRYRAQVTLAYRATLGIGAVLLLAGAAAWLLGQPRHVVFPLAFAGLVMVTALGHALATLNRRYSAAELRRIAASDM